MGGDHGATKDGLKTNISQLRKICGSRSGSGSIPGT